MSYRRLFFWGAPTYSGITENSKKINWVELSENVGKNLGNMVIANYFQQSITYDQGLSYNPLNRKSASFTPGSNLNLGESPQFINENFDAFVIISANFLFKHLHLEYAYEVLKQVEIPFIVTGLGAQSTYDYSQEFLESDTIKANINFFKLLSERSKTIGVRGYFTADCLNKLGIKNIRITGCPSWYANGFLFRDIIKKEKPENIILHLAQTNERTTGNKTNHILFDELADYETTLVLQDLYGKELDICKLIDGNFNNNLSENAGRYIGKSLFNEKGLYYYLKKGIRREFSAKYFYDIHQWKAFILEKDFCIGKRIHSTILSLQNGIPAAIIAHDSRTREMAELFRIPMIDEISVNKNFSFSEFYSNIDFSELNSKYFILYNNFCTFLAENNLEPKQSFPDNQDVYKHVIEKQRDWITTDMNLKLSDFSDQKYSKDSLTMETISINQIEDSKESFRERIHQLEITSKKLKSENINLRNRLDLLEEELVSVYLSNSWRITRPFRKLVHRIRR